MADFADLEDVETAWRPLSDAEAAAAEFWLPAASALIRAEFPTIDDRIESGDLDAALVRGVAVSMVRRIVANPNGAKSMSVQIEDYQRQVTLNDETAAAGLFLTADERRILTGRRSSAYSIRPAP